MKIKGFLNQPYPFPAKQWKTVISISLAIGIFMFMLQPFGLASVELKNKGLFLLGYSLATCIPLIINTFLLPYLFSEYSWTIVKQILWTSWVIFCLGLANYGYTAGILFIAFGSYHLFHKQIFGIVFLVFGLLGLRIVKTDFSAFRGKLDIQNTWLIIHIQRMIGAYIAALTAFLVVNNKILPGYIAWLLPTVILLPLIIIWTKKYTVKRAK